MAANGAEARNELTAGLLWAKWIEFGSRVRKNAMDQTKKYVSFTDPSQEATCILYEKRRTGLERSTNPSPASSRMPEWFAPIEISGSTTSGRLHKCSLAGQDTSQR